MINRDNMDNFDNTQDKNQDKNQDNTQDKIQDNNPSDDISNILDIANVDQNIDLIKKENYDQTSNNKSNNSVDDQQKQDVKEVKEVIKSEKKNNIIIKYDSDEEKTDKKKKDKNTDKTDKTDNKFSDVKPNVKTILFPYKNYSDEKNESDDDFEKNANPFGQVDPLSILFANILNSMTNPNPNANNDFKFVPTFIEIGLEDSSSESKDNEKEEIMYLSIGWHAYQSNITGGVL
jgi:hypothetical protein